MTAPQPRRSPVPRFQDPWHWLRTRWIRLWVLSIVGLFLVPTLLLAVAQRRYLAAEEEAWETTLDPSRPDPGLPAIESFDTAQARRVTIGFYMESMEHISLHDGGWRTILDVWCTWDHDPSDPDFDPFDHLVPINGRIEDSMLLRERHADGLHYVHRRMDVEFNRTFRVVNFPFDRHLLLASFENSRHPRDELVFLPDEASSAVSRRATTVGYGIERFHAVENPHSYQTSRGWPGIPADRRGTWSQPRFAIEIVRQGWGQFLLMFQALFVAVAVALLSCFIKPIHVDPRFGLGVGALFAAVANGYLVGAQMPENGEFSLADLINLLGIGTIFITLAQSTISLWIYETRDDPGLSRHFDRVSFWTVLACFAVCLATLLAGAVTRV
jgi:hypothetical protein